ncbi:putative leucine-rich repeat receptor-like protein kinase At2g19210 [Humulus lupulus]|uniref:putative leucine-rich repeat receptor-like protein kinase At2g19210 n=1 Tax=Humulus lupulus TaxID=3486 RepID=UPI002B413CA0|nr:putative leucine-rich repeat receptor-like protein kinase At2g19210 [Humulus lupulus]
MVFSKHFLVPILLLQGALIIFPHLVRPQDLSGFISIDCGSSEMSNYINKTMGINMSYFSDQHFTDSGEKKEISQDYKEQMANEPQLWNVRSFPNGTRNCYTVKPTRDQGTKYLIRATFLYGNYDNIERSPTFDLYIGADLWGTVAIKDAWTPIHTEIIHVLSSDHFHVCLVNTRGGTPFITVLELRPLGNEIYETKNGTFLRLYNRADFSSSTDKEMLRYKDDAYDRLWRSCGRNQWKPFLTTSLTDVNSIKNGKYQIPFTVMNTAYTRDRNSTDDIIIEWDISSRPTERYFLYFHFAELEQLDETETREFNIYVNNNLWYKNEVPKYLVQNTIQSTINGTEVEGGVPKLRILFRKTEKSTLPPLINAIEVYVQKELSLKETNQMDAKAIWNIKAVYELKRNWQGDPCTPNDFTWDGLECDSNNSPNIVSLNLSSCGLKGEIASSIANLTMLKHLDLSNNSLSGTVPEFLAQLSSLIILNLKGNNLTGSIPDALLERSKNNQLYLSFDTNLVSSSPSPCSLSGSSCGKKQKFVVPLVASLGGSLFILFIIGAIICILKRRSRQPQAPKDFRESNGGENDDPILSKKQEFTYSEIQRITNNFERIIGEGGFGKVYYGNLKGNEVAVKMLSPSSLQGHQQFHAELKLLLRVHHRNLTTLVGYCNEKDHIGLLYEYMAMGNLRSLLLGRSPSILSWEDRLRIAIDTAQGLEYLHNGCKPPIIHRDVKSTNILLNEKFQAKLGDFGVSKIFSYEGDKQGVSGAFGVSTNVVGTPGYLDPEYYASNWLNEKSDVFSFGVVLLELITARPVLTKTRENAHICQWVGSKLVNGDIENIIDPKLEGFFCINTVWKAIEIAMACVSKTSTNRPTMIRVAIELKECLTAELTWKNNGGEVEPKDYLSVEMINNNMALEQLTPLAR